MSVVTIIINVLSDTYSTYNYTIKLSTSSITYLGVGFKKF